jgi:hypothetical protein
MLQLTREKQDIATSRVPVGSIIAENVVTPLDIQYSIKNKQRLIT